MKISTICITSLLLALLFFIARASQIVVVFLIMTLISENYCFNLAINSHVACHRSDHKYFQLR